MEYDNVQTEDLPQRHTGSSILARAGRIKPARQCLESRPTADNLHLVGWLRSEQRGAGGLVYCCVDSRPLPHGPEKTSFAELSLLSTRI
jgi:hypothetical protein